MQELVETIGTALLKLPDDIIYRILNNTKIEPEDFIDELNSEISYGALYIVIDNFFIWEDSEEGNDYWEDLYNEYRDLYYLSKGNTHSI